MKCLVHKSSTQPPINSPAEYKLVLVLWFGVTPCRNPGVADFATTALTRVLQDCTPVIAWPAGGAIQQESQPSSNIRSNVVGNLGLESQWRLA